MHKMNILLVEDNLGDARLVQEMLKESGSHKYQLDHVSSLKNVSDFIVNNKYDVILLDLGLAGSYGLETLRKVLEISIDIPIILLTGLNDEEISIEAMKQGAQDYLVKGTINSQLLVRSIRYAIERQQLLLKIQQTAILDDLTGLFNRRGFLEMLDKQIEISKRTNNGFLIVYVDIDRMKEINDTYGHKEGDLALMKVASILKNTFREIDIISRIGGDEFVVLALNSNKEDIKKISTRLLEQVVIENKGRPYELSISKGIVSFSPSESLDASDILSKADKLMYLEKDVNRKKHK